MLRHWYSVFRPDTHVYIRISRQGNDEDPLPPGHIKRIPRRVEQPHKLTPSSKFRPFCHFKYSHKRRDAKHIACYCTWCCFYLPLTPILMKRLDAPTREIRRRRRDVPFRHPSSTSSARCKSGGRTRQSSRYFSRRQSVATTTAVAGLHNAIARARFAINVAAWEVTFVRAPSRAVPRRRG